MAGDIEEKKNLDIVSKKIEQVKSISVNKKRVSPKRDPKIRVQKIIPDSVAVKTSILNEGMRLGCVIFNENQILMEVDTELDNKKIEFLSEKTDIVYIIPEKDQETQEEEEPEEERIDIMSFLEAGNFSEINSLIQKNALRFDDFKLIFHFFKKSAKNPEIDRIYNTVLQYYDLNIRENILESIKEYDPESYYRELFRVIVDFDIEDINDHKNMISWINAFFVEKNTTFFKILASYYDVLEEDKKNFVFELLKKIEKDKLKKLLIVYSSDKDLKDLAFQLLNAMKNDFVVMDNKEKNRDNSEKTENVISFSQIMKEIEERKNRKERILAEISKINCAGDVAIKAEKKKKPLQLLPGDVLSEAFYYDDKVVYPADTILSDENIAFIRKYSREEIQVYNLDDLYSFFSSITEKIDNIMEKVDMFIYLFEQKDGKSELETLSILINFQDREIKIAALKYMITNLSPKRFSYIIAAMNQDIPELSDMLKTSFESRKDLFSFKLFLKVASDENNSVINKKIREFVKKSTDLLDMVRIIIRTAPPQLKKLCFDILG